MQRTGIAWIAALIAAIVVVVGATLWRMGLDPVSARCAFVSAPRCLGASSMYQCVRDRMYCCRYGLDCHWVDRRRHRSIVD